MVTLAVGREAVVGRGNEGTGYWNEKVRNIISAIKSVAEPYLASGNLDYLESSHRSSLTAKEKALIDGDLMGLTPH